MPKDVTTTYTRRTALRGISLTAIAAGLAVPALASHGVVSREHLYPDGLIAWSLAEDVLAAGDAA